MNDDASDEIGDAVIVRHDDGTRTVRRATPIIRVAVEALTQLWPDADVIQPDGALQLDSAGEYRYRYLRSETPHVLLYERVTDA